MTLLASPRPLRVLAALVAPAALTLGAPAQDENPLEIPPPVPPKQSTEWRVTPVVEYQFGGNEFDAVLQTGVGVSYRTELKHALALTLGGRYRYDDYDFESGAEFDNAWGSVHTLSLRARLDWRVDNDWTIFGGPIFVQAREESIDLEIDFDGNSLFGAFFGASHRVDDALLLGGGFAIMDEYQDQARFIPIIILDWEITNDLRLSTLTASSEGEPGIELIFDIDRDKELAGGIGYRRSRFRLDSDGIAPDGVGEVSGLPIWGRFTMHLTPEASLTFRVGLVLDGELELETDGGTSSHADRDTAGLIGVSARFKF